MFTRSVGISRDYPSIQMFKNKSFSIAGTEEEGTEETGTYV